MSSTSLTGDFWGPYLIKPDKSPTFVFEQLLLGIANYIVRYTLRSALPSLPLRQELTHPLRQSEQIAPWDVHYLTPPKLAAFYRVVGGNYDLLFNDTPPASLSFIYQSMGCFHTLQPEKDPYAPPSTPALTPQGFVRWQTVQLLLEPEEHVPFLQEAVKRFELVNPADGLLFPILLPKEALPSKPDVKMTEWHDTVSQKLMLEAQVPGLQVPNIGARSADLESSQESSVDARSLIDPTERPPQSYPRPLFQTPNFIPIPPGAPPTRPPRQWSTQEPPWSPEHRRSSLPTHHHHHRSAPSRDGATPTSSLHQGSLRRHRSRSRSPSTLSTTSSSSSSSSSLTASSTSFSPRLRHHHHLSSHLHPPPPPQLTARRHSTPNSPSYHQSLSGSYFPPQHAPPPPRGNARGLNVRWRDMDTLFVLPSSAPGTPGEHGSMRLVERSGEGERGRGAMRSPLRGVGGRRYATEGINWR